MDAYRCDGCGRFEAGRPLFAITPTVLEYSQPEEFHCCAWTCVEDLAKRKGKPA